MQTMFWSKFRLLSWFKPLVSSFTVHMQYPLLISSDELIEPMSEIFNIHGLYMVFYIYNIHMTLNFKETLQN